MKFERVAHLTPDSAQSFDNRATALVALVGYVPDAPNADGWLADAHAVQSIAISLSPDTASYWRGRVIILITQARRSPMDGRDALLADADAQSAIAHKLEPEDYGALVTWGSVCGERARFAEDATIAIGHAREAIAKFEAAAKVKPDTSLTWISRGIVCYCRASDEPERRTELLAEASGNLVVAERLDPEDPDVSIWWAYVFIALARHESDTNAAPLLAQAGEKATKALRGKPDSTYALTALCNVCIRRADRETDPERRTALFAEATRYAGEADAKRPGSAAYNRAVIAALTGDEVGCEKHLREAVRGNHVSNRRRVRADEDLAAVRNAPWFRELFGHD